MPWSKFKVLLATGGKTNHAPNKCLDTKFKSYYLYVDGRTKPPTSVLVKNLSPTTYRWKDEPSHPQFKSSYLRVEGQTKPLMSALVKNLSTTTYEWKDKPSHSQGPWYKIYVFLPMGGRTNQVTHKCLGTKFKPSYL